MTENDKKELFDMIETLDEYEQEFEVQGSRYDRATYFIRKAKEAIEEILFEE